MQLKTQKLYRYWNVFTRAWRVGQSCMKSNCFLNSPSMIQLRIVTFIEINAVFHSASSGQTLLQSAALTRRQVKHVDCVHFQSHMPSIHSLIGLLSARSVELYSSGERSNWTKVFIRHFRRHGYTARKLKPKSHASGGGRRLVVIGRAYRGLSDVPFNRSKDTRT